MSSCSYIEKYVCLFHLLQRANSESSIQGPYMRGSASSFKKLSKFFGEEPPRVEDIETFLEGLGYSHLYPVRAYMVITY